MLTLLSQPRLMFFFHRIGDLEKNIHLGWLKSVSIFLKATIIIAANTTARKYSTLCDNSVTSFRVAVILMRSYDLEK